MRISSFVAPGRSATVGDAAAAAANRRVCRRLRMIMLGACPAPRVGVPPTRRDDARDQLVDEEPRPRHQHVAPCRLVASPRDSYGRRTRPLFTDFISFLFCLFSFYFDSKFNFRALLWSVLFRILISLFVFVCVCACMCQFLINEYKWMND